jgi:hypothetical protein
VSELDLNDPVRIWLDRMTPELPTAVTRKAEFHPQPASYSPPTLSRNGLTK